jgi:hypothetical protein
MQVNGRSGNDLALIALDSLVVVCVCVLWGLGKMDAVVGASLLGTVLGGRFSPRLPTTLKESNSNV